MRRIGQFVLPVVVLALLALISFSGQETETVVYTQSLLSAGIYLWIIVSWRWATGGLMDPYFLFATAVFLFNAGQTVLYALGLIPAMLKGEFSDDVLTATLTMVNCYLVAMHLGALMVISKRRRRTSVSTSSVVASVRVSAMRVGCICLAISFPFALIEFRTAVTAVYTQGYFAGMYQRDSAIGVAAISTIMEPFLIPGAFFLLAGARRNGRNRWIAASVISLYILIQFFLGFRAAAIVVATSAAWLWNRSIKRLRPGLILLVIVGLTVLLPIIAAIRNTPGANRLNLSAFADAYQEIDNPAVSLITEMGQTMAVNAYVLEFVPSARPYDHGMTYAYGLTAIIPNFFWQGIHPAALNSPSRWLIDTVDPVIAEAGGGIGFSVFGEAYLNFGPFGGGVMMLLLGSALAGITVWTDKNDDIGRNALVAVVLCFLLVYARAEIGNVTRGCLWYGALPYILYRYLLPHGEPRASHSITSRRWLNRFRARVPRLVPAIDFTRHE